MSTLEIRKLSVHAGKKQILRDFSLELKECEVCGLTGRSGAGKTTLIRAICGFQAAGCRQSAGEILLDGRDVSRLDPRRRRDLCGKVFGYIPQSPMTAFDPRVPVGKQMTETFQYRLGLTAPQSRELSAAMLKAVNLPDTDRIFASVPGDLSGGMLQRTAMAILLGMHPRFVLADEPTSALDVENRHLLLELMREHCRDAGILLISHDVEAMESLCGRVCVLDEGHLVEEGMMQDLLTRPRSAWTRAFAASWQKRGKEEWTWTTLQ